jgi:hypothetical protein
MPSYRNVLCGLSWAILASTIASMELHAGELVQLDAVSADAGSLRLFGYLTHREDRRLPHPPPSSFSITVPVLMISPCPGPTG